MASIESKNWTEQELDFIDYKLDTRRDTTLDGSRRCDYCYRGTDYDDDMAWMRCTKAATVKIRVSYRSAPIPMRQSHATGALLAFKRTTGWMGARKPQPLKSATCATEGGACR